MATDIAAQSPESVESVSAPIPVNAHSSNWDQPQSGRATPQDYPYNTPPSYAGSFGSNPDSSNWPGDEAATYNHVLGGNDDYNPTDFDVPDASPSEFNNLHFFEHGSLQPDVLADLDLQPGNEPSFPIHLSFTPAEPVQKLPHQQPNFAMHTDISSPGSSPGSVHNDRGVSHSRASSVSSVHSHHSHHSPMLAHHSLSPDAAPQFSTTGPSPPTSPQVKAQSPPALVIPTDTPNVQSSLYPADQKPTHLLPGQPAIDINIVPSTPISGGVANNVPFQQVLHTLNQQNALNQPQIQGGAGAGGASDVQGAS
ncbi:hypothetical protein EXIGLDRAFT_502531 [Exidia glandulosa HHB12029]|uniref:Uncharacterized protein n=1 Tax=Exidia glandulosa HHB12029 TaxID=1314781 RepID=A0A165JER6_EXIGL|nr:hypothetical protein EXIGLDRAFT_502531 [Exidia glandulosa HHB12029]